MELNFLLEILHIPFKVSVRRVSKRLILYGIQEVCLSYENYDTNTMVAALDYLGYRSEEFNPYIAVPEDGEFLGLLLNLGIVEDTQKHWVALKFKSRQADGTVVYTLFDSLLAKPVDLTLAQYLKTHPLVFKIKVFLPKGAPKDPLDRLKDMELSDDALRFWPVAEGIAKQSGWQKKVSATKKEPYWYNPTTDVSVWMPPGLEEMVAAAYATREAEAAEAAAAAAKAAEAPKAEPAKTEVPKAESPKAEPAKTEVPKVEAPKAEPPKAEAPKGEWKRYENSKGVPFWYNPTTKEKRREPPPGGTSVFFESGPMTGLHSLNNVLGEKAFVEGKEGDVLEMPRKKPISMMAICRIVLPELQKSSAIQYRGRVCSPLMFDDIHVLRAAVNTLGFSCISQTFDPMFPEPTILESSKKDYFGMLVDLGGNSADVANRWVAFKRNWGMKRDEQTWTLFDPREKAPVPKVRFPEFLKKYSNVKIYHISNYGIGYTSPLAQYQEPMPLRETLEKCIMVFDPCTRELMNPDPKLMRKRFEEVLAKQPKKGGTRRRRRGKKGTRRI